MYLSISGGESLTTFRTWPYPAKWCVSAPVWWTAHMPQGALEVEQLPVALQGSTYKVQHTFTTKTALLLSEATKQLYHFKILIFLCLSSVRPTL
jgi:hypothetical protein